MAEVNDINSNLDELKEAMLSQAPEFAEDYRGFTRRLFSNITEKVGSMPVGEIAKDKNWGGAIQVLRSFIMTPDGGDYLDYSLPFSSYVIDEPKLKIESDRYGTNAALEWFGKVSGKLGSISNIKLTDTRGGNFVITGDAEGHSIRLEQKPVFKVSQYGTPFHQFPALIYVDGQFYPESDYKRFIRGLNIDTAPDKQVTQYKCNKCGYTGRMGFFKGVRMSLACPECRSLNVSKVPGTGPVPKKPPIDPYSRPRKYKFEWKVDLPVTPWRSEAYIGEVKQESVNGMSKEEAWSKIYRSELSNMLPPMNYYTKVYSPSLIAIFSWNGSMLWNSDTGDPLPEEEMKASREYQPKQTKYKVTSAVVKKQLSGGPLVISIGKLK